MANHSITKATALAVGVALSCVSITCEILFFWDFGTTTMDFALAIGLGGGLVMAQFVFVRLAVIEWKIHWLRSIPLWIGTALLFSFSVVITASYFESRFSNGFQSDVHLSLEYQTQKQIIDGHLADAKAFKDLSKSEELKGNYWIAGQHLKSANEATKMAQEAMKVLESIQPQSKTTATALGSIAGEGRWLVWLAIACLVDAAPLLCFAYTTETQAKTKTKTETAAKTIKNQKANIEPSTPTNNGNQGLTTTAKAVLALVQRDQPKVREIGPMLGIGYPKVKAAMDELIEHGLILWPESSKTYSLIKNS